MANEQYETFDFTEVERPASGGVVISGDLWVRDQDQIGIGGALSYDCERFLETYTKRTIADGLHVSLDYQFGDNPVDNLARGQVSLFALPFMPNFQLTGSR